MTPHSESPAFILLFAYRVKALYTAAGQGGAGGHVRGRTWPAVAPLW